MSVEMLIDFTIFFMLMPVYNSANVQFSDPEKAFSLRQFDFDINYVPSESQNSNNNRGQNSDRPVDRLNSYKYYHSSFMLLRDGHADNKLILKDSGFVVEENLGANPSILNRTLLNNTCDETMKFKMINHQSPKRPKTIVKLFYAMPNEQNSIPSSDDDLHSCSANEPFVQAPRPSTISEKNLKFVADVQLIDENPSQYVALPLDKTLNILVPNRHFYPGDIFAAIILYHYVPDFSMDESVAPYLFQIKCEAKNGVRLLGTEQISYSEWSTSTEMLYKQAALTITAFYRGQFNLNESFSGEIISILLQIAVNDETADPNDVNPSEIVVNQTNKKNIESDKKPYLIASINYVNDWAPKDSKDFSPPSSNVNVSLQNVNDSQKNAYYSPSKNSSPKIYNIRASFNVEKDSIKSLVPIGKVWNWHILPTVVYIDGPLKAFQLRRHANTFVLNRKIFDFVNTAVLTRNQISTNLKIFSLSYAGVVSDVTLQTACTAREVSVIKVTPTCTSVYADGSESRGDMNALINVTYANFRTTAKYNVWYPEFPVDILISDPVLHAIKNWRIHDEKYFVWTQKRNGTIMYPKDTTDMENKQIYQKTKIKTQRLNCRLRFQESMVKVFARFRVDDLSTGRRSYLGGRKTQFDVTFLSRDQMKILDPRLAYLKTIDGTLFVHGLYPGRTEVQSLKSVFFHCCLFFSTT
uniref:Transmembrane protein family 132 middle domain-containing protein n=1 Tax=Romanomermis culicivorax TaxID=13658 RepID=A0A915J895_ROMCU